MKICELMKNYIKNYIKIMGLAAIPFGTAQATNYEIRVRQEHKPDAEHFKIEMLRKFNMGSKWKILRKTEIVWPHDKELPNPIWDERGLLRKCYEGRLAREMDICTRTFFASPYESAQKKDAAAARVLDWINFYRCGDASKILTDDKTLRDFLSSAEYRGSIISKDIQEKVLKSKEKSGEEIMRDSIKKHRDWCCLRKDRSFLRAAGFPNDCSYECYHMFEGEIGDVLLYLVKDGGHLISKSKCTLVLFCCNENKFGGLRVMSDIPTVFFSFFWGGYIQCHE